MACAGHPTPRESPGHGLVCSGTKGEIQMKRTYRTAIARLALGLLLTQAQAISLGSGARAAETGDCPPCTSPSGFGVCNDPCNHLGFSNPYCQSCIAGCEYGHQQQHCSEPPAPIVTPIPVIPPSPRPNPPVTTPSPRPSLTPTLPPLPPRYSPPSLPPVLGNPPSR